MHDIKIRLVPDGLWHRRSSVVAQQTACGQYVTGPVLSRDLDGDDDNHMCPICFHPDEIETTKFLRLTRHHETEDGDLYFSDEEPTDPWTPPIWPTDPDDY